jgi:hypothetical protein
MVRHRVHRATTTSASVVIAGRNREPLRVSRGHPGTTADAHDPQVLRSRFEEADDATSNGVLTKVLDALLPDLRTLVTSGSSGELD